MIREEISILSPQDLVRRRALWLCGSAQPQDTGQDRDSGALSGAPRGIDPGGQ